MHLSLDFCEIIRKSFNGVLLSGFVKSVWMWNKTNVKLVLFFNIGPKMGLRVSVTLDRLWNYAVWICTGLSVYSNKNLFLSI